MAESQSPGANVGERCKEGRQASAVQHIRFPCMQQTRPLQDHPEFSVRRSPSHTEYRVENWRIARDGSGRVLRFYGWSWFDYAVPVFLAAFWQAVCVRSCEGVPPAETDSR